MSLSADGRNTWVLGASPSTAKEQGEKNSQDLLEALYSPAGGIAAALRSVGSRKIWSGGPDVLSPRQDKDGETSLPLERVLGEQGCEVEMKETIEMTSASKYIHASPLYQDYWSECMRTEMNRIRGSSLSGLVASMRLPGLLMPPSPSAGIASAPRRFHEGTCLLWQDLPEVRENGLLETLGPRERQLQEATFELISSEASYLKSLTLAVTHFQESRALRLTLPMVEHHILFSNLVEVKGISERFLLDLEARLEESVVMRQVGDVVLQHRAALRRVYVPYITNMMYQETLIQRLMQQNRGFLHVLKKLEKAPVCQRQSLKSFLVLPFQRVARLRIILENILKLTSPDLDPVPLKEAITAIHQILTECDESVQRMKQTEKLVHLEKLVDFKRVKSIPLITRGRTLLYEGFLHQVKVKKSTTWGSFSSFCQVYLHLFNDLLLLSLREEERFHVLDYATFPACVRVEQLTAEALGLSHKSFLLHLTRNHAGITAAYILAAKTSLEKETWLKALGTEPISGNKQL
ncbi:rho guanine nucleotide exchange factor 19 [Scleropages formosus]|uniref:rho guanine nucleotide exchange factor 19 n=1 Tax=Scleropages formosus TaxID=113540 RepID=UPI00087878DD|nr:rho guanine nucleotide exchange factor 19-like [Scleropages formosus]